MNTVGMLGLEWAGFRRTALALLCSACVGLLAACGGGGAEPSAGADAAVEGGVASVASVQSSTLIEGQYIVTLLDQQVSDVPQAIKELINVRSKQVLGTFNSALKGFVVQIPASVAEQLRLHPDVLSVEQDREVQVASLQTQDNAPYWLDRIDQFALPLNNQYQFESTETGVGVRAYIVDTGIRATHQEFGGRVVAGFSVVNDGRGTDDCNGHGTHVSALTGGATRGVARGVTLVPVRVFDCTGSASWSTVIQGLEWVRNNAVRPAVVSMSLTGPTSDALDASIRSLVGAGLTVVVAAGNNGVNACNFSPSRVSEAIAVGASNRLDSRASYSNFGACLDLFAPGDQIESADHVSDTAVRSRSGTSQAVPLVAGVAATVLQRAPTASAAAVSNFLRSIASLDRLSDVGANSPNLLLFSRGQGTPVEPQPRQVAVGSISATTIDLEGGGWALQTRLTALDLADESAVEGANISVSFSLGDTSSCETDATGGCTVVSGNMDAFTTSTVVHVSSVSGPFSYRREFNRVQSQRVFRR
jgi:subtilisin family serine protease